MPGVSKYCARNRLTSPLHFIRLINWASAVVSGKGIKETDEDVSYQVLICEANPSTHLKIQGAIWYRVKLKGQT